MAGAQDAWRVSGEDRAKHDQQFFQLKPSNGFVTGTQARDFFMQSGLPTPVLGQIWGLADINNDGKMDRKEFSIAMHLIKKKLQGYELPKSLPASMKADPSPVMGSFAQPVMGGPMPQQMNMGFQMGGMSQPMNMPMGQMAPMMGGMSMAPMIQPQASLGTATMTTGSLNMGPRMANGAAAPAGAIPESASGAGFWAMPHNIKLKHTQTFNAQDRNKRGYLLGVEARSILMQSGLPQPYLAQIWTLSDIDRDGKLTCDEFCIAMHLLDHARMGHALPATLPAELVPTKTRSGSIGSPPSSSGPATPQKAAFGDLLSSAGMPMPQPIPAAPVEEPLTAVEEQVTFEDKRKENFDKGQAELERRRALLREQQQKDENERLEKERQAAEKRERQRIEAENKRQAELQRQLERQREREQAIEEQRRKMQEQREAARREMERQRQMEWEKTRKEQLMAEKQREYEQLSIMKSHMANMKNELESLDAKKVELSQKISQVQKGVTDFTSSIDAMRVSRDRSLADIDVFERQTTELNKKLSNLNSEKDGLSFQVQTAQATPLSDAHKTVLSSVETKRTNIHKLKKEVEQLESDTEARLGEIDCNNAELRNLKEQLANLERDIPKLQKLQAERDAQQKKTTQELQQKQKAERERQERQQKSAAPAAATASNGQTSWFDFNSSDLGSGTGTSTGTGISWDSAFSGTPSSAAVGTVDASASAWGTSNGTAGGAKKEKYRALYDFHASRDDELSLVAGAEVFVLTNYSPVPGMEDWHKGEKNGSIGWFPKAYVEQVDEPSTDLFGSAFEPVVQSSAVQSTDAKSQFSQDLFGSSSLGTTAISSSTAVTNPVESSTKGTDDTTTHIPDDGLLAKAIYPWKARQETDLTFDKDETILVKEQQEMKWFGEANGKSGWFPKAYVKLIGVAPKADASDAQPTTAVQPAAQASNNAQGEYYIAMYTYTSGEASDLTFNEGDMIYVTASTGDWWTGTISDQGKTGIFPANYVKKLDIQEKKAGPSLKGDAPKKALPFNTIMASAIPSITIRSATPPPMETKKALGFDDIMQGSLLEKRPSSTPTVLDGGTGDDLFADLGGTFNDSATKGSENTKTGSLFSGQSGDPFGKADPFANSSKKADSDDLFGKVDPFANVAGIAKNDDLFGSLDPFAKSTSGAGGNDPFGKVDPFGNSSGKASNDEPFGKEDPFGNSTGKSSNDDPFSKKDPFGNSTGKAINDDPFSKEDPFGNLTGNASKEDPFDNTTNKASNDDPFGQEDPFGNPTGKASNDDPFGKEDPFNKATNKASNDDPFGKEDPFGNSTGITSNDDQIGKVDPFGNSTGKASNDEPFGKEDPFGNSIGKSKDDDLFGKEDPFGKTTDEASNEDPFGKTIGIASDDDPFGKEDPFGNLTKGAGDDPFGKVDPFANLGDKVDGKNTLGISTGKADGDDLIGTGDPSAKTTGKTSDDNPISTDDLDFGLSSKASDSSAMGKADSADTNDDDSVQKVESTVVTKDDVPISDLDLSTKSIEKAPDDDLTKNSAKEDADDMFGKVDPFASLVGKSGDEDPFGGLDPLSKSQGTSSGGATDDPFAGLNWGGGLAKTPVLPRSGSGATDLNMIEMDAASSDTKRPDSLFDGLVLRESTSSSANARGTSTSGLEGSSGFDLLQGLDSFSTSEKATGLEASSSSGAEVKLESADSGNKEKDDSASGSNENDDSVSPKKSAPPRPSRRSSKNEEDSPEQKSVTLKKPEIARVIAPYTATGTGQLSLEMGNLINVRQKSPRGWWEGELQARGQKKKIGWFPANYVKLLGGSSARSTPEPTASALAVGGQGSRSTTPLSTASQEGLTGATQETVVALYAYTAQNDDELTFQKDAVITVLSRDNPDWWSGQLNGQTGVFPSNYVTPSPHASS